MISIITIQNYSTRYIGYFFLAVSISATIYFGYRIVKNELEARRLQKEIDKSQKLLDRLDLASNWIDENRDVVLEYFETNYSQDEIDISADEFLSIIEQLMEEE